ncbi:hypothetical protein Trydic_g8352 [Trypoxylus dichotomus]
MRSIFLNEESIGQAMQLADMIMGFTTIQIQNNDGLPGLICMQCTHEVIRAFSFKQLCEQSDTNLRQYLGKPLVTKNKGDDNQSTDYYTNNLLLDNFGLDDSSNDSDDSYKEDFGLLDAPIDVNDEKAIAQKQLLKAAKLEKCKLSKKKFLAKNGKIVIGSKKQKRNGNQCNVCKKQFINLKSFRKHLRTHIEDRPYKCKLCPRGFTEENYLNNHMRTHIPEDQKPHECKICQKRFTHTTLLSCYAENSLLKHMKIHEKKEGDPAWLKHICDYCKSEFPDAATLDVHIKQHTGDRPFLCERPFTCEICKNGYVSKASLKIHMRTHTNERPFACEFCGKAFRQSGDLTSHKRLHGTEKPIECSVCQKRFTTVMKLKYHMRNHTGERPYVCNICGRGFTVNTILLRHMRVHSGERPFVCVTCGKAFSQSSTLNTHMKVHAPSPKYGTQEPQRMHKYHNTTDQKYEPNARLVQQPCQAQQQQQTTDNRIMQEPTRMMQPDNSRILTGDSSRIVDANHLLPDNRNLLSDGNRLLSNDGSRLLVNSNEPPRLLVNENARLLSDNRILAYQTIPKTTFLILRKYGKLRIFFKTVYTTI